MANGRQVGGAIVATLGAAASIVTILAYVGLKPRSEPGPAPTGTAIAAGTGVIIGPPDVTTLSVYSEPSLTSRVVSSLPIGSTVKIICIVYGDYVTGPHGVSSQWDRIAGGFIPDAAVRTGPDRPVEPGC